MSIIRGLRRLVLLTSIGVSLMGCAHHHAKRVDCDGPLRPINRPVASLGPFTPAGPNASQQAAASEVQEP
jgi:hypothetical protein